jgi:hypothetical protein
MTEAASGAPATKAAVHDGRPGAEPQGAGDTGQLRVIDEVVHDRTGAAALTSQMAPVSSPLR